MRVVPEDGNIRGIDHRIGAERVALLQVEGIHRSVELAGEERGRAAMVFLLGALAGEEAAAGDGR